MICSFALGCALAITTISSTPQIATPSVADPGVALRYDVASIKPSKSDEGWKLQPTLDGFLAENVTLRSLVEEAYGIYDDSRVVGGPKWIDNRTFDVTAKIDNADVRELGSLTLPQRGEMLQILLAERFKLVARHELQLFPVYSLRIARPGPRLSVTKEQRSTDLKGVHCFVGGNTRTGHLTVRGCSMTDLAGMLRGNLDRAVVDDTGLDERYDFELRWNPDPLSGTSVDAAAPPIRKALEQQLGLYLDPTKRPLPTIVIVSAEPPTSN